jgi:hypothetical protein
VAVGLAGADWFEGLRVRALPFPSNGHQAEFRIRLKAGL